jgi:hypothetical protein
LYTLRLPEAPLIFTAVRPVACQQGTKLHWSIEITTHGKYIMKFCRVKNNSGEAKGGNFGRKWQKKMFRIAEGCEWNLEGRKTIYISVTVTQVTL